MMEPLECIYNTISSAITALVPFNMTYEDMITQACASVGGKFMSRSMIKTYLTKNFGYVDNATSKNHLKKALAKFERKGDSFRVSKAMKQKGASAEKAIG